jgi:hypothetical protein
MEYSSIFDELQERTLNENQEISISLYYLIETIEAREGPKF